MKARDGRCCGAKTGPPQQQRPKNGQVSTRIQRDNLTRTNWFNFRVRASKKLRKGFLLHSSSSAVDSMSWVQSKSCGPADCPNWGKWGLTEYIGKRSFFLGWFIVQVQEILVLPWLTSFRETARRKTVILGDLWYAIHDSLKIYAAWCNM